MKCLLLLGFLGSPIIAFPQLQPVPTIVVTKNLTLSPGSTMTGRIVVRASHVVIDGAGATLQGPGSIGNLQSLDPVHQIHGL